MECKEIFVDRQGMVKVLGGLRVIKTEFGKVFVRLGDAESVVRMSMDGLYPPEALDVSGPSEKYRHWRIFEAYIKEVTPRDGSEPFTVLTSRMSRKPEDELILRVSRKFSKTPLLLWGLELSDNVRVLAEGFVPDFCVWGVERYSDQLLVLGKGAELRFETRGGKWLFVNHGAGVVQLLKLEHEELGESPLAIAMKGSVSSKDRKPSKPAKGKKPKSGRGVAWPLKPSSSSDEPVVSGSSGNDDSPLAQALRQSMAPELKPAPAANAPELLMEELAAPSAQPDEPSAPVLEAFVSSTDWHRAYLGGELMSEWGPMTD